MIHQTPSGTAYQLTGPASAPVVALVHGLGIPHPAVPVWTPFVEHLSDRFRVLDYQLYGHGNSGPPPGTPSLMMLSEQLRDLLDFLDIARAAVVGFSLGGMINRRLALDHPARVSALGIFNSPHERTPEAQAQVEARARDTCEGGPAATIDATLTRWFTPTFIAQQPDRVAQVRAVVLANDPQHYTGCRWVLANGVLELLRPRTPIAAPALVMTCEHDSGSTPAMSRAIAAEMTDARTKIVPDLQHMGLLEQPAEFLEPLQRFLDAHVLSA